MSYDINKIYEGYIIRTMPDKKFGFIKTLDINEVFFHFSRFDQIQNQIEIGKAVSFKLIYSKKNPGKVSATQIKPIDSVVYQNLLQLGLISSDEQFDEACKLLDVAKKENLYDSFSNLAYKNSLPLFKLRLWINKYVKHFDFELFKKCHFRLRRQEAAEFKRYVKENIKETKRHDFRILGNSVLTNKDEEIKIYETSWRNIGFEDRIIWINIGSETALLTSFKWNFSRVDFNLIVTGYISRKDLKSIKSKVCDNKIIEIEGLEQLQEAIKLTERSRAKKTIAELINEGWTPKQIREHPDFVTLGNEDLLRLFGNHECIDYLQKMQSTNFDMPLIYVVEKRPITLSTFTYENSYLFSIILPQNKIAIVWESLELDRATQVFVCKEDEYFDTIKHIDDFLSSFETKKRTTLRSDTEEGKLLKNKFKFRESIKHTQYDIEKWKQNLLKAIPELRDIILKIK